MIGIRRDLAWFSVGFSFLAMIFYQGLEITLGRTVFMNLYEIPLLSATLNVLAAVFLALTRGYYIYAIPLSFLSYIFLPELISVILFVLGITALREIPTFARDVLLGVDAFGLTYVILALVGIRINLLMLPVIVLQNGPIILVPLILLIGIIYGFKNKEIPEDNMNIPLIFAVFVTLAITTIPLSGVNPYVKFMFSGDSYYNWLLSPSMGKFFLSRPLYLVLLYLLDKFINPVILLKWQVPMLSLIFIISAYRLGNSVKQGMGPLSTLLASVSPIILASLYSSLQADLLSLSFMLLSLSYLLVESTTKAILFSYLSMLSHIFTWAQFELGIMIFAIAYLVIKHKVSPSLRKYIILTAPALILSLVVVLGSSIPLGFSPNTYLSQISVLSWGTLNALLFFVVSIYGLDRSPRIMYAIFALSVIGAFFVSPIRILANIPLFIPASLGILKLDSALRVPMLILFVTWALIMSLNSFPYMYGGVTI